jgi:hypothetical protein
MRLAGFACVLLVLGGVGCSSESGSLGGSESADQSNAILGGYFAPWEYELVAVLALSAGPDGVLSVTSFQSALAAKTHDPNIVLTQSDYVRDPHLVYQVYVGPGFSDPDLIPQAQRYNVTRVIVDPEAGSGGPSHKFAVLVLDRALPASSRRLPLNADPSLLAGLQGDCPDWA